MDDKTIFYLVGGALTLAALVISLIGVRNKQFPPEGVAARALLGFFTVLVLVTAVWAVLSAREEQAERREHLALAAEHAAEEGDHGASETETDPADPASPVEEAEESEERAAEKSAEGEGGDELETQGAQVFAANGCGSCHTMAAADASGTIGPNLDETLADRDAEFIRTAIVDPEADIAEGFGGGIMPTTYGEDISAPDLDALVAFIRFAVATSG